MTALIFRAAESVREVALLSRLITQELGHGTIRRMVKRSEKEVGAPQAVYRDPRKAPVDLDALSFVGPGSIYTTEQGVGPVPAVAVMASWLEDFSGRPVLKGLALDIVAERLLDILGELEGEHPGLEDFAHEMAALRRTAREFAGEPSVLTPSQAATLLGVSERTVRRYATAYGWVNYGAEARPRYSIEEVVTVR